MTRPLCTLPLCRPCLLTRHLCSLQPALLLRLHPPLKQNDRRTAVSGLAECCLAPDQCSPSQHLKPPFLPLQQCHTIGSVTQIPWRRASASPAAWTGPTSTSPDILVSCVRVTCENRTESLPALTIQIRQPAKDKTKERQAFHMVPGDLVPDSIRTLPLSNGGGVCLCAL